MLGQRRRRWPNIRPAMGQYYRVYWGWLLAFNSGSGSLVTPTGSCNFAGAAHDTGPYLDRRWADPYDTEPHMTQPWASMWSLQANKWQVEK